MKILIFRDHKQDMHNVIGTVTPVENGLEVELLKDYAMQTEQIRNLFGNIAFDAIEFSVMKDSLKPIIFHTKFIIKYFSI